MTTEHAEKRENDLLAEMLVSQPTSITNNTGQEVVVTTRDKVELALRRNLPKYTTWGDLLTTVGLLIALVTALASLGSSDVFGLPAAAIKGALALGLVFVIGLSVRDIYRLWKKPTMDDLVDAIAKEV